MKLLQPYCSLIRITIQRDEANLFIEVDGAVAERDAIAEAVLASRSSKLPIQPDVLPPGMRVKAQRLQVDVGRRGGRSSLHT